MKQYIIQPKDLGATADTIVGNYCTCCGHSHSYQPFKSIGVVALKDVGRLCTRHGEDTWTVQSDEAWAESTQCYNLFIFLAKAGIQLVLDGTERKVARINNPKAFRDIYDLWFIPPLLESDEKAKEVFLNTSIPNV